MVLEVLYSNGLKVILLEGNSLLPLAKFILKLEL